MGAPAAKPPAHGCCGACPCGAEGCTWACGCWGCCCCCCCCCAGPVGWGCPAWAAADASWWNSCSCPTPPRGCPVAPIAPGCRSWPGARALGAVKWGAVSDGGLMASADANGAPDGVVASGVGCSCGRCGCVGPVKSCLCCSRWSRGPRAVPSCAAAGSVWRPASSWPACSGCAGMAAASPCGRS
jgi:hypothetical protein